MYGWTKRRNFDEPGPHPCPRSRLPGGILVTFPKQDMHQPSYAERLRNDDKTIVKFFSIEIRNVVYAPITGKRHF